jgi:hypothetical protein
MSNPSPRYTDASDTRRRIPALAGTAVGSERIGWGEGFRQGMPLAACQWNASAVAGCAMLAVVLIGSILIAAGTLL